MEIGLIYGECNLWKFGMFSIARLGSWWGMKPCMEDPGLGFWIDARAVFSKDGGILLKF